MAQIKLAQRAIAYHLGVSFSLDLKSLYMLCGLRRTRRLRMVHAMIFEQKKNLTVGESMSCE